MAANAGMIGLVSTSLNGERLDIEDNIGEGIHIHYKNFRLDFTVEDMIRIGEACEKALKSLEEEK